MKQLTAIGLLVLMLVTGSQGVINPIEPVAGWQTSRALALTPDGTRLLVVNPDSDSLSVVDTAVLALLAEIPVGNNPRTAAVDAAGQRAYVTVQDADVVAVVDLETLTVLAHIPAGRRPYGVVVSPDGTQAYVSAEGGDEIVILDTSALTPTARIATPDRPRALALSSDGNRLYAAHLLSNEISVWPLNQQTVYLPIVLQNSEVSRGELVAEPSSQAMIANPQPPITLFPDSNLVTAFAVAPDGRTAYIPHTRANTANAALTFDTTVFPLVSLLDLPTNTHLIGQQFDLGTLDPPGVGLPHDAAVTPGGSQLWVVNAGSNDLTVLDLATRQPVAHIQVGDYPQAIVLTADGTRAFVNNTLAGTVSVVDTAVYTVTHTIPVTDLPLPPLLRRGKQLFFSSDDPRISQNQWIACNTCHFEGGQDGRTWQFGFAGPRNTTGLLDMIRTYPLRWSGEWDESADAEFSNRKENFGSGLLPDEMHCALSPPDCANQPPNQGRAYDLDALAAYMDSLAAPLSPDHAQGAPLTEAELRGQALFLDPALGCVDCHPPPLYTDHLTHDVGTVTSDEQIGPAYDTPTLWGLYDSAPYFHDGSAATLAAALTRATPGGEHDVSGMLTSAEWQDLSAFLQALPFGEER